MKTQKPDNQETRPHNRWAHSQVRLAKKVLRPFPRRTNIHRWPILKWFAKAARKQPHFWKFGTREVSRAIYLGSIIAFLPIPGFQFVVAFFVALAVRANLPVIMGMQLITNIFTGLFIYGFTGFVGNWLIGIWHLPDIHDGLIKHSYNLTIGGIMVGLLFGLVVDLLFRFILVRRLNRRTNVKRMLKS